MRRALEAVGGSGSGHSLVLHLELWIADVSIRQGRAAEVEPGLRRLIEHRRSSLGDDHWRIAQARSILGACLSAQGRFDEAEPLLVAAYERLLEGARARYIDDALGRLRQHLERAGKAHEIAAYEARRAAS